MTMIIGGSDTVPLTVSNTLLLLDKHPHFKEAIIKDLSLISNAYNETIRYEHPNNMLGRTVIKETNFYNKSLKAGDKVMMLFASALRDERVFEDPDKYDIYRDSLSAITFGIGIHKCVGEHLARLEAKLSVKSRDFKSIGKEISDTNDELVLINEQIDSIPSEIIDIRNVKNRINNLVKQLKELKDSNEEKNEELQKENKLF